MVLFVLPQPLIRGQGAAVLAAELQRHTVEQRAVIRLMALPQRVVAERGSGLQPFQADGQRLNPALARRTVEALKVRRKRDEQHKVA